MDFAYTPEQLELKGRAAAYAALIANELIKRGTAFLDLPVG
jgi:hypothetical protein